MVQLQTKLHNEYMMLPEGKTRLGSDEDGERRLIKGLMDNYQYKQLKHKAADEMHVWK